MKDKILLVDGHSILNRAFYGLPDLTNAEGLHTNAIYGFLTMLFKVMDEEKPDYLTVAFDVSAKTFRHEMFKEYKGTRKPMADELREQVPIMKEVLTAMGITIIEKEGLEADDILGTLSVKCESQDFDVVILSGDRDLLQLATKRVKIRIPKTSKGKTEVYTYYDEDVVAQYHVTPDEFIDVKALMGDSSDNIPGVPSIGEKTATKIIVEYKSIENAYAHIEELKPPRAANALKEHYDLATLSKELATIEKNGDFPFELSEAKLENIFTKEAYEWFQKLEFKNLFSKFEEEDKENSHDINLKVVEDKKKALEIFDAAKKVPLVGFALKENYGISLCYNEQTYVILGDYKDEVEKLFSSPTQIGAFQIKDISKELVIHTSSNLFDGIIAAYLMNPLKNDYTYKDVAREQLNLMLDEMEPQKDLGYEAYTAFHSQPILEANLKQSNMYELFTNLEMPLVLTLDRMEKAGVMVDAKELEEYGNELQKSISLLETDIYKEAGEEFNINSPKQLGVVLFENLGLPHGKKTKTGYSTAADVLEKLAKEFPIVDKILEYRQLTKLKSTYADGLAHFIGTDGRIHGKFHQTITATGRLSSTEPNLQNIPIRMELGRRIRKVFKAKEDYVFVDADYSQIELRILAVLSKDENLIKAYQDQSDIHRITASNVFNVPFDEVTPLQRRNAKAVNFGIVYGISSFGLSQDLSITRKEAETYIENYFKTYPGIKKFLDTQVEQAKENGYVTTLYHRRRPVPELSSSNYMQRSFGERVAMNAPIQGTAADIMKMAMNQVSDELEKQNLKSKLVLQVHDELLIETHKDEVQKVKEILVNHMEKVVDLSVPLEIDIHVGENWYEAK
ncbi:DNA polymerase-1 [Aequitasia blattaphilus]|uniref:DNA polymerase I n=1 Tax=Aequitasia blattaphilus TaxID=2949332 RepID=A0ABT1E790_9FIRM|nr:DNA polymerase I [Aequitasia blattaphilus]MCP1101643.1 DNA polymerase I [Aequitasia blattaphilus]MCR8614283.1 DNA polymerase I [Aequitasia blattaphilus]